MNKVLLPPFYRAFLVACFLFSGTYALGEFLKVVDRALSVGTSLVHCFEYVALRLPEILFEVWLPSLSVAAVAALVYSSRHRELLALKTLGISGWRVAGVYFKGALRLSVPFWLLVLLVLPSSSYWAAYTWNVKVKKQHPDSVLEGGRLFVASSTYFLSARLLEPGGALLQDVLFVKKREGGGVGFLVFAKRARFEGEDLWTFYEGSLRVLSGRDSFRRFESLRLETGFSPELILTVRRPIKSLGVSELLTKYEFLKRSGASCGACLSELLFKLLYPLNAGLSCLLSGIFFLGARGERNPARGASSGLFCALAFFSALLFARSSLVSSEIGALLLYLLLYASVGGVLYVFRKSV